MIQQSVSVEAVLRNELVELDRSHDQEVRRLETSLRGHESEIARLRESVGRLQANNDALRTQLAERNAKYWTLHEAVERLFKTIADEKREEGR